MKIMFLRSASVGSTFLGACLLVAGCGDRATPVVEMRFGTTQFAFGVDGPAGDYVRDYHSKLPAAAGACGVALLGFNGGITDGGEAAYFSSRGGAAKTKSCLKHRIPNGTFEVIEHDSWEQLKRANSNFPVPLAQMHPQIEVEELPVKPAK
ncbi:hypothetical protein [Sphingomonas sp. 28-63-12]|uniref:hypothetical protein n=1 Tax=Sphingomonas sp. 28-63-12 TaxID=1970434 RepID=UPI0035A84F0F